MDNHLQRVRESKGSDETGRGGRGRARRRERQRGRKFMRKAGHAGGEGKSQGQGEGEGEGDKSNTAHSKSKMQCHKTYCQPSRPGHRREQLFRTASFTAALDAPPPSPAWHRRRKHLLRTKEPERWREVPMTEFRMCFFHPHRISLNSVSNCAFDENLATAGAAPESC
jgi:hypothetical protein